MRGLKGVVLSPQPFMKRNVGKKKQRERKEYQVTCSSPSLDEEKAKEERRAYDMTLRRCSFPSPPLPTSPYKKKEYRKKQRGEKRIPCDLFIPLPSREELRKTKQRKKGEHMR